MSEAEILEKAILIANENGWHNTLIESKTFSLAPVYGTVYHVGYDFLFNKDFAKALWGSDNFGEIIETEDGVDKKVRDVPEWEYRLQQMVVADNPIDYLGDNL